MVPLIESSVADRVKRGRELFATRGDVVEHLGRGVYRVPGCSGNRFYRVDLDVLGDGSKESCSCPDHKKRGGSCKHIVCATIHRARTVATRTPARFVKGAIPEPADDLAGVLS